MLKNISTLKGAQQLTKNEQKTINGGKIPEGCLKWDRITKICSLWDPNF